MGKSTAFLYLNEADMVKAGVLDSKHCVDVLDEMFQLMGKGDYVMGGPKSNEHGIRINFPDNPLFTEMPANGPDRRFMAMIAYLGGRFNISGCKWYGSNVINPARGLPRSILMVMLNDPDTCEPVALMSANLLSAVRTGSVPGVGVRYLARKESEVCTIIGAGPVNKACLQGIMAEGKNLKEIAVYDVNNANADKFIIWAEKEYHIKGTKYATTEEAVRAGDIISVAASRLKPVIIKNEWLKKGSTLILTGNCLLDDDYMTSANLVFDNPMMHEAYMVDAHRSAVSPDEAYKTMMGGCLYKLIEAGKLPPLSEAVSLGGIALGKMAGRKNDDDRFMLQTGGMPVEDVAWGFEIYSQAKKMGLGQMLKIWDEPLWS